MAASKLDADPIVTQDVLHERLHYDPLTGVFVWHPLPEDPGSARRGTSNPQVWNNRYAGKRAGRIKKMRSGPSYVCIHLYGREYRAHRLAWLYMTGEWPSQEIDHRDVNGLNNAWGNLRLATTHQNHGNQGAAKRNTSGFKGVSFHKLRGRWRATIANKHLGLFDTPEEAHAAYCEAAQEYFGRFARFS